MFDLDRVVHSVELDGVRVLLLRMAPNDGVRVLLLHIVACTSSFYVSRECFLCTWRPLVCEHGCRGCPCVVEGRALCAEPGVTQRVRSFHLFDVDVQHLPVCDRD